MEGCPEGREAAGCPDRLGCGHQAPEEVWQARILVSAEPQAFLPERGRVPGIEGRFGYPEFFAEPQKCQEAFGAFPGKGAGRDERPDCPEGKPLAQAGLQAGKQGAEGRGREDFPRAVDQGKALAPGKAAQVCLDRWIEAREVQDHVLRLHAFVQKCPAGREDRGKFLTGSGVPSGGAGSRGEPLGFSAEALEPTGIQQAALQLGEARIESRPEGEEGMARLEFGAEPGSLEKSMSF